MTAAYGKGRGGCRRTKMSDSYKKFIWGLSLSYKRHAALRHKQALRPEGLGAFLQRVPQLQGGPPPQRAAFFRIAPDLALNRRDPGTTSNRNESV
ncbi:MAG: hypothetical protein AB7G24_03545 [Novosphingobium sp.]